MSSCSEAGCITGFWSRELCVPGDSNTFEARDVEASIEESFKAFCSTRNNVNRAAPQQELNGHFAQVLCLMSKARDGAIVTDQKNGVTADGPIVSSRMPDPTDIKTAFLHFHEFGNLEQVPSYLLLPLSRSTGVGENFVCPINAKQQSNVPVLAAGESGSIVVEEVNYNDTNSETAREWLWFAETTVGALWRLYLTTDDGRKLYMAADSAGKMFLTEDEPLSIQREGMENPATNLRLFLKHYARELSRQRLSA